MTWCSDASFREAEDPDARRTELIGEYHERIGAVRGAEGFGYDAILLPSQTRAWMVELLPTLPRHRLMQSVTPRRHPVSPL